MKKKRIHNRQMAYGSLIAAGVAAALALPTAGWAQTADATLRGHAPPGSEVTAKNVATGAVRRTKTNTDGTYTLPGLPSGTYRVDAGAGTEQAVTLSVASIATLDLGGAGVAIAADATLEEVIIKATRLVEVKTSEVGSTVSLHEIETVPQLTRNFLEFADSVPGMVFNVNSSGKATIRGGGQKDDSVNIYIDGVGQKGYVRSGQSGQTDNTQGNPFPQLAIGEYKVITSNYKAEYDQISSAAITAETKSGTNEFHGEAFGTYTNDGLRAPTPGEVAAGGVKTESSTKEFGAAFGGPIIQDKAHFFVTYKGKRYTTPVTVNGGNTLPALIAQLPAAALAQLGPSSIAFNEDLIFGKLDFEPTASDFFSIAAKIRNEKSQRDQTTDVTAVSASLSTKNTDNRWDAHWKHNGDNYLNELLVTYEDSFFVPNNTTSGSNGSNYTFHNGPNNWDNSMILMTDGVSPLATQNKGQKGWSIGDDITFNHLNWLKGDHTVKAGFKYKSVDLTAADSSTDHLPVYNYDVSLAGTETIPYKVLFGAVYPGLPTVATSKDHQLGLYLQDDWAYNDKLTLNLGVRYDLEWNPSYLDFVTPKVFTDALATVIDTATGLTYGQSLGLSTNPKVNVNINDYVSNGHNRSVYKGEIQPRLGFSYDIDGDQKHVVFGGVGRSYDRNLYDYLQLEITKFAMPQREAWFNTATHPCTANSPTPCVAWDPTYLTDPAALRALFPAPGEINLINNNLKTPYADQFALGIRNKIGDWNTSASVVRILTKDGLQFTLGNRHPDGSFWQGGSQPWGNPPPGFNGNLILGSNGIETRSTQLLLSAEKPFTVESGWGATVAYTFTDASHNRDINEHYVFDAPTAKELPFIMSNAVARHRLVATGSVAGPWDTMWAGKLTIATPIPINDWSWPPGGNPTGANNVATAVVAGGYAIKTVDMQVTKNFNVTGGTKVYLRLDALNVFNTPSIVDYNTTYTNGWITSAEARPNGNISGTMREFRLSLGAKF